MQTKKQIKILLMGISGDLSMQKVLPSLAEFKKIASDKFDIELIGYSRSKPDEQKIQDIVKTHGDGFLLTTLRQGSYEDPTVLIDALKDIRDCDKLIIYLALPPSVFLQKIKNACLYAPFPMHIIIEKPYAQSYDNLIEMLAKIDECGLQKNVHFFDHYLFKPALDTVNPSNISQINYDLVRFSALETIGVENRMGYFATTGAIKDMLPHLYSLLQYLKLEIDPEWHIDSLKTSYYEGYAELAKSEGYEGNPKETFFDLILTSNKTGRKYQFVSGKKQEVKQTTIEFLKSDGQVLRSIDMQSNVAGGQNEHVRLFSNLSEDNHDLFVSNERVIDQWKLLRALEAYQAKNKSE